MGNTRTAARPAPAAPENAPGFSVYRARDGWRWRFVAPNARTMADSGEAYTRRRDAERALARFAARVLEWAGRRA